MECSKNWRAKIQLRLVVLRNDKKTGCVLVDPVNKDSHPLVGGLRTLGYS